MAEFPAPFPTNRKSLRVYETGTGTGSFSDNEFPFSQPDSDDQAWSNSIRIINDDDTAELEISFDGSNIHGIVKPNSEVIYRDRYEGGISVRGDGAEFTIEAW